MYTFVVGVHWKGHSETLPMSPNNKCFNKDLFIIYPSSRASNGLLTNQLLYNLMASIECTECKEAVL